MASVIGRANINQLKELIYETKESLANEWEVMEKEFSRTDDDWRDQILCFFDEGDNQSFYSKWNAHCSEDSTDSTNEKRNERLKDFRQFLDTKGKVLSQISEFLPYYAFPYVPNPQTHPVYRELFEPEWAHDLKQKLKAFLETVSSEKHPTPKLLLLQSREPKSPNNHVKQLQNRLADAEKRVSQAHQKSRKLQNDYQSLLEITTDLVDTLEAALRGDRIGGDVLQEICSRLVASQRGSNTWPADSLEIDTSVADILQVHKSGDNFSYGNTLRQSLRTKPTSNGFDVSRFTENNNAFELDFDKINDTLKGTNQKNIWRLLQALRWRLTKVSVDQREENLTAFIKHDLLDLTLWSDQEQNHHVTVIEHCLNKVSPKVTEATSRLVNAFASLSRGRAYLSQNQAVASLMSREIFHSEADEETATRENLIGALQKLSLRRSMQTTMTEIGMVEWLIRLLENTENLSDYTLEYAVALFMNLCLRTAGKKRCVPMHNRVLKVLTDLISHENTSILSYVNGALFSLLTLPEMKMVAEAMDLEGTLTCFMQEDQQELNRQFEYIIKQMQTDDQSSAADSDAEDEDDDDDEEDADQMERDIDRGDDVADAKDTPLGENLLCQQYRRMPKPESPASSQPFGGHVRHNETAPIINAGGLLRRPSTPNRHRGATPTQIPLPAFKPQTSRKSNGRPSQVQEETPTRGRIVQQNAGETQRTPRREATPASDAAEPKAKAPVRQRDSLENHPEYQKAFNSRPKILRTPEHKRVSLSMDPGDVRGNDRAAYSRASKSRPMSGRSSMDCNRK